MLPCHNKTNSNLNFADLNFFAMSFAEISEIQQVNILYMLKETKQYKKCINTKR